MLDFQRAVNVLIGAVIIAYLLDNVRSRQRNSMEDFQQLFLAYPPLTQAEEEAGLASL
jgi:hypothetical protein